MSGTSLRDEGTRPATRQLRLGLPIRQPVTTCGYCAGIGTLEATDMFCGAGGSSLGLEHVRCPVCARQLVQVTQAINHWDLAVLAHNANFPDADHDVHGVQEIPASRFRRTPLFWASPACQKFAGSSGAWDESPEAQRSRATFRDVIRFTAHHRYDAVFVENVVEARRWCEHGAKCQCGAEFDAWLREMEALGYDSRIVYFNSQFALPTPQSRDRMYIVFWRSGLPSPDLDFRPQSWCSSCEDVVRGVQAWKRPSRGSFRDRHVHEWGRYGANYVYRCPRGECGQPVAPAVMGARSIIDFGRPIERIGDKPPSRCKTCGRRHPVACNTRRRIRLGYENVGRRAPLAVQVGGNLFERDGYARVWSLDRPVETVIATSEMALVTPAGSQDAAARPAGEPMHAVTGSERLGLVVGAGGQTGAGRTPREVDEPLGTVTTENHASLVLRTGGQAPSERSTGEPTSTITAHDRQIALVELRGAQSVRDPGEPLHTLVASTSQTGVVMQNMENNVARDLGEPAPPVTTGGNHMLVQPCHGGESGGRARSPDEPTPTLPASNAVALVELRNHGTARDGDEPMHTVVAGGTHHGVLVYNGNPGFVRSLDDAAGTVTARDKQALLVPIANPTPARTATEPLGTVTTHDREALVLTDADIDDCYLRMLQWEELLRAQVMDRRANGSAYELTARTRDRRGRMRELSSELRTKMIGNAVSSPVATMLGTAVVEVLR